MCLAKIYVAGDESPALEDVASLTLQEGKVIAETLFGERRVFAGAIRAISFTDSKVDLEPAAD